jgi:hypothetical protein
VQFSEPPLARKKTVSQKWVDIVAELKSNPNQWALVGNYSPGVATHIRRGRYPAFLPEGETNKEPYMGQHWEITTRKTDNGSRNDVYIRWLG